MIDRLRRIYNRIFLELSSYLQLRFQFMHDTENDDTTLKQLNATIPQDQTRVAYTNEAWALLDQGGNSTLETMVVQVEGRVGVAE